jgi:pyrroloquinoline quinone (PQQ) biosynthesis protein C
MVRVYFPNLFMRLVSINKAALPHPMAKVMVQPKMTKTEVKEYLRKIYNIPVLFVNTANFLGISCYLHFVIHS